MGVGQRRLFVVGLNEPDVPISSAVDVLDERPPSENIAARRPAVLVALLGFAVDWAQRETSAQTGEDRPEIAAISRCREGV